ncbi:hypothetical protein NW768_002296 [Fusarium equiseti]|uniref:NADP-dependent oxidoreductase domain-containing protein n=1 Tax=Fusarium equiseti TaxID=61235 RepID=A0ABQ8RNZ4_FUSEQ|nr:hypothetical protein NW768_002296 [Fusarium equiseti]
MGINFALGSNLSYDEAEPVSLKALELGCTFWDTAISYRAGVNEKLLGDFIRTHNCRDKFFIAKIHAIQAEYSVFETIHEVDGLIDAARKAYIAHGPLGHGWIVEDFSFDKPEDFNGYDYCRQSKPLPFNPEHLILTQSHQFLNPKVETSTPIRGLARAFKELATRKGCMVTQVAFAWVAVQDMIALAGTTSPSRLEENWAARDMDTTKK